MAIESEPTAMSDPIADEFNQGTSSG